MVSNRQQAFAGLLIFASFVLTVISALLIPWLKLIAGLGYFISIGLLWGNLTPRNRIQSLIMLLLGFGFLVLSYSYDPIIIDYTKLLSNHSALVSMLVAVSFLGLVSSPLKNKNSQPPQGNKAIASTLGGIHLMGSVINISSIFIVGDRIGKNLSLTRSQVLALSRGFSSAAFWSPFFAAMAVALNYAPQAKLSLLMATGLLFAVTALCFSYWEISRKIKPEENETFTGFPFQIETLWLPALLALSVFISRWLFPQMSILTTISLFTPILVVLNLLFRQGQNIRQMAKHIVENLPRMVNEIMLFQSAGILGYGLFSLTQSTELWPLFNEFGALEAGISVCALVFAALLGIHPIVGISFLAPLLSSLSPDHTLMALVFLSSWALGTATSPLSGINLSLQGRYGISSFKLMRWNLGYMSFMLIVVFISFQLLGFVVQF